MCLPAIILSPASSSSNDEIGMPVTSFIDYGFQAQDLLQPVLKVKASQPDIVVQVGYFRAGVLASKAFEQLDFIPW